MLQYAPPFETPGHLSHYRIILTINGKKMNKITLGNIVRELTLAV